MTARCLLALKGQGKYIILKFLSAWESKEFAGVVHLFAMWMERILVVACGDPFMSLMFPSFPGAYYVLKVL